MRHGGRLVGWRRGRDVLGEERGCPSPTGLCHGGRPRHHRGPLECGFLCFGFARVVCMRCNPGFVVAFSCKGRGVCPSCNGRRMAQTAAHLVDHVTPCRRGAALRAGDRAGPRARARSRNAHLLGRGTQSCRSCGRKTLAMTTPVISLREGAQVSRRWQVWPKRFAVRKRMA